MPILDELWKKLNSPLLVEGGSGPVPDNLPYGYGYRDPGNFIAGRKSPLGFNEFEVNKTYMGTDAETPHTTAVYNPRGWNNSETQSHERLHVGQAQINNQVPTKYLESHMDPGLLQHVNQVYPGMVQPELEIPATAFGSFNHPNIRDENELGGYYNNLERIAQQDAYNSYIDETNRLNPGQGYNLVAPSHQYLQEGYVNHPIPINTPQQNIPEETKAHLFKRMLGLSGD